MFAEKSLLGLVAFVSDGGKQSFSRTVRTRPCAPAAEQTGRTLETTRARPAQKSTMTPPPAEPGGSQFGYPHAAPRRRRQAAPPQTRREHRPRTTPLIRREGLESAGISRSSEFGHRRRTPVRRGRPHEKIAKARCYRDPQQD